MSAIRELRSKLIMARKMRNESDTNEVFDYWDDKILWLTYELKRAQNA